MNFSPRGALVVLLLLFALLAGAFSMIIPLGEAADEVSHQSYVRYVAEHGGLPPVQVGTSVFGETFQPPLYYALVAPLTAWLPYGDEGNLGFSNPVENNPDWQLGNRQRARVLLQPPVARWPWGGEALGWHLVRFVSVLFGLITIWATYHLAGLVFPDERWTPVVAASFVGFLPSFVGLSAVVTNDVLLSALCALFLWRMAQIMLGESLSGSDENQTSHLSRSMSRDWLIIGLLGGLSVWAKASGWVLVGTTLIAVMLIVAAQVGWSWLGIRSRYTLKETFPSALLHLFVTGSTWLLIVLPLWWINWQRSGDILGRGVQQQVTEARTVFSFTEFRSLLESLYHGWWAGFGGAVHLYFPMWLEGLLLLLLLIAGAGLLKRHLRRHDAPSASRLLIPWLGGHIGLVIALWLVWSLLVMGTGQGRLLFPALPAIAVLLAGGLMGIIQHRREVALAWSASLLALPVAALFLILLPTYRAVPANPPVPAEATLERWQVANQALVLTAFHSDVTIDDRVKPGRSVSLYVAWQAEGALPDLRLRLRWLDKDGNLLMIKEGSPIANHPLTDEWQAGSYAAIHHMQLPSEAKAGWYQLLLSVIDPATDQPLLLEGANGGGGPEIMVGQMTMAK